MIELKNITKSYHEKCVFAHFSCQFNLGKTRLVGPNGSGKSTLLMMIAGLDVPSGGEIVVDGTPVCSVQKEVALASDRIIIPEFLTAKEAFALTGADACHLLVNALAFEPCLALKVSSLSSGEYKKLQLLLALTKKANWYLLDEPANALDAASLEVLDAYLSRLDANLILVSHENHWLTKTVLSELSLPTQSDKNTAPSEAPNASEQLAAEVKTP